MQWCVGGLVRLDNDGEDVVVDLRNIQRVRGQVKAVGILNSSSLNIILICLLSGVKISLTEYLCTYITS